MKITRELEALEPPPEGSVVSIGVFDGVHLGHQAILGANVAHALDLGCVPTVVTFQRHPKELLVGHAPKTLTTLEHRLELFARSGVQHAVALAFDEELRGLSARDFVRRCAVEGLGVRRFVLGFDSKFGHDRAGSAEMLRAEGFEVEVVPKVVLDERGVSSTVIREAVELGELERAAAMLGRRVSVFGRVVRGDNLGREIGFPTANLDLHHELHPPAGVYACRTRLFSSEGKRETHDAVANIGFRPTVEVHLLDFEGDLYGERLELAFFAHLRGEERFPDLASLSAQIQLDVQAARKALAGLPEEPPAA